MKGKKIVSTLLALLLLASLPVSALAAEWDIGKGDITVNAGSGGQTVTQGSQVNVSDDAPVITGTSTDNTLTINAEKDQTANVTLSGANIDVSSEGKAAVTTTGDGNVSIELDDESTLKGGYKHAGLEKNNVGSLTIGDTDKDGKLTAKGGQYGAGIGGGYNGNGSDISITSGEVNATGGTSGAGIGGGYNGNGSDITITDGEVNATGGKYGAGIGGGEYGIGKGIIITGGEVNATGGRFSAGIGGGSRVTGSDIKITGGEVNASGGVNGAGIGGGLRSKGIDITVSGDTKLKVQGGDEDNYDGAGAGIGDGGSNAYGTKILGAEVEPDICALKPSGKIEYYAPGSDMTGTPTKTLTNSTGDHVWDSGTVTKPATCTEKGVRTYTCTKNPSHTKNEDIPALDHSFDGQEYVSDNNATYDRDGTKTAKCVRYDQCGETHTIPDEGSQLKRPEQPKPAPLYRVTDRDGRDIVYTAERKDGVLTVTVDADFAVLTGRLSGIRTLMAQGVEKLVFVTKGATSAFHLSDLTEKGESGEAYRLTHDGEAVTFTLGESMADVRAILTKP